MDDTSETERLLRQLDRAADRVRVVELENAGLRERVRLLELELVAERTRSRYHPEVPHGVPYQTDPPIYSEYIEGPGKYLPKTKPVVVEVGVDRISEFDGVK